MGLDVTIRQHPVVDILIRHSRRLQKIRASFLISLIVPLARITPESLERLEDLELNFDVDNSSEELDDLTLFFAGDHSSGEVVDALGCAPRLRSVKLRLSAPVPRMPWTQLTVLVIEGFTLLHNASYEHLII